MEPAAAAGINHACTALCNETFHASLTVIPRMQTAAANIDHPPLYMLQRDLPYELDKTPGCTSKH